MLNSKKSLLKMILANLWSTFFTFQQTLTSEELVTAYYRDLVRLVNDRLSNSADFMESPESLAIGCILAECKNRTNRLTKFGLRTQIFIFIFIIQLYKSIPFRFCITIRNRSPTSSGVKKSSYQYDLLELTGVYSIRTHKLSKRFFCLAIQAEGFNLHFTKMWPCPEFFLMEELIEELANCRNGSNSWRFSNENATL